LKYEKTIYMPRCYNRKLNLADIYICRTQRFKNSAIIPYWGMIIIPYWGMIGLTADEAVESV
jgi:hypothetical protein